MGKGRELEGYINNFIYLFTFFSLMLERNCCLFKLGLLGSTCLEDHLEEQVVSIDSLFILIYLQKKN